MRIGLVLGLLVWWTHSEAAVEITGEFLYLRPSFCHDAYAVTSGPSLVAPVGPVQGVVPSFAPGVRVAAGYLDCDSRYDITLTYTRLHQTQSARSEVVGAEESLWPVVGIGLPQALQDGTAVAKTEFDHDCVELQIAHRSVHDPGFLCLRAWAGLRYAKIKRPFAIEYEGERIADASLEARVRTASKSWGIGPMVGVNLRLDPFHCIGIGGAFSVGLLVGDRQLAFQQVIQEEGETPAITQLHFRDDIALFPAVMARLGLNYCLCLWGVTTLIEVGYEFADYLSALQWVSFGGSTGAAFSLLCDDARMDGLYVAVRVGF